MDMHAKKLFLLSWKRVAIIVGAWIAAVILHNALSALLRVEEPLFFIIAIFVIPIYAIISVIYTIYKKVKGE